MAALAVVHEGAITMPGEASLGFTGQDRETLLTVKLQLGFVQGQIGEVKGDVLALSQRITRIEETRITERDLKDLMEDTDTLRAEKKVLEERLEKHKENFEARLTLLERWRWTMLGMAAGAGAIVGLLFKLFGK